MTIDRARLLRAAGEVRAARRAQIKLLRAEHRAEVAKARVPLFLAQADYAAHKSKTANWRSDPVCAEFRDRIKERKADLANVRNAGPDTNAVLVLTFTQIGINVEARDLDDLLIHVPCIDARYDAEHVRLGIDACYLIEALRARTEDEVAVGYTNALNPMHLRDDDGYEIIMPVRL